MNAVVEKYAGTRLGRQELNAEMLDDVPGALWTRDMIDATRLKATPEMRRVVIAVDPSGTSGAGTDGAGEAVEKLGNDGAIPEIAMNKAVQNLMSEREWMPGMDQALADIPEAERFGLSPDDDGTDLSKIVNERKEVDPNLTGDPGGDGSATRRRAANDKVTTDEGRDALQPRTDGPPPAQHPPQPHRPA